MVLNLKLKNYRKFINKYNLYSFKNNRKVKKYVNYFKLESLIINKLPEDKIVTNTNNIFKNLLEEEKKPYFEDYNDLCRLHWIVLKFKMLNVLEFGSGFSTVFIAHALNILKNDFKNKVDHLRVKKKFFLYSIDESKKFIQITKKRLPKNLKKIVQLIHAKNKIINYEGKYATVCNKIPETSPDMIYLDGPSTFATKESFNGFKINDVCRFPMSCDILLIEYFLEPGTIIIVDGRTANARFLKDHFKRKWKHFHDYNQDYHYFELIEKPLGIYNERKIKFKKNI